MNCAVDVRPVITQGATKILTINLVSALNKRPFDLTNATGVAASFLKTDGTVLVKNLSAGVTVLSAIGGIIQVTLNSSDTTTLAVGNGDGAASFVVDVVIGGQTFTVIFNNEIIVQPRPF